VALSPWEVVGSWKHNMWCVGVLFQPHVVEIGGLNANLFFMSKLGKNRDGVHGAGQGRDQGTRGSQAPGGPVANPHRAADTLYVGHLSLSPRNPIRFAAAENIMQAADHALALGYPLEYHLTVKWLDKNRSNHQQLLRKIGKWQDYHIGKRVFVWSREATGGHHSHILLHIPRDRIKKFRKLGRAWLKQILGLRSLPTGTMNLTVHRKIGVSFDHMRNRVRYILKGADADTRLFLGCTRSEWGYVEGKRAGVSQGLGVAARRKAGGVLPSGVRKVTRKMLAAAVMRDRLREEAQAADMIGYATTSTPG